MLEGSCTQHVVELTIFFILLYSFYSDLIPIRNKDIYIFFFSFAISRFQIPVQSINAHEMGNHFSSCLLFFYVIFWYFLSSLSNEQKEGDKTTTTSNIFSSPSSLYVMLVFDHITQTKMMVDIEEPAIFFLFSYSNQYT